MLERFKSKKHGILARLAQPDEAYVDASPKGSVDEGISALVAAINKTSGLVTTSSCAGRIAVYLEGPPKEVPDGVAVLEKLGEEDTQSGTRVASTTGGKGGGKWLFTSHAPVYLEDFSRPGAIFSHLGLSQSAQPSSPTSATKPRFVHFKFEPMILHILASSAETAQATLSAAVTAGFRESGISGLFDSKCRPTAPMVAVRTTGLALDSIIGFHSSDTSHPGGRQKIVPIVSEEYLRTLLQLANDRFEENESRKQRFSLALAEKLHLSKPLHMGSDLPTRGGHEPKAVRAERMKQEGLLRKQEMLAYGGALDGGDETLDGGNDDADDDDDLGVSNLMGSVDGTTIVDHTEDQRHDDTR